MTTFPQSGSALVLLLAVAAAAFGTRPLQAAPPLDVAVKPGGPIEVVFDHDASACAPDDVPDEGSRAFRDARGMVHLIASGARSYAMVGPTLNTVRRVCAPLYEDQGSADPSRFDDMGWLEAFYTLDGRTVHALVSHDYHPERHHLPCGTAGMPKGSGDCWYSNITQATSLDGGATFTSPPPGAPRFVAGAPYRFDPDHAAAVGVFVVSNIVAYQGAYYAFVSVAGDQAQRGGDCLMRTTALGQPAAWRAWDGAGFNVSFIDPYATPVFDPAKHVCAPVAHEQLGYAVRSLLALADGSGFVVTMDGAVDHDGVHAPAVFTSASPDLIHWSAPSVVITFEPHDPGCTPTSKHVLMYGYSSLLDPGSLTRNFETVGRSAYLYMMRVRRCGGLKRDLVRLPVTIDVKR